MVGINDGIAESKKIDRDSSLSLHDLARHPEHVMERDTSSCPQYLFSNDLKIINDWDYKVWVLISRIGSPGFDFDHLYTL